MDHDGALPDHRSKAMVSPMPSVGEIVPVIGKVVAVGPSEEGDDATFQYLTIEQGDGSARHFAPVCALPELAGFLEKDTSGTFVFLSKPDGCRLCFAYSDLGPRGVDFDAVRGYLEQL
jgi:hypothetical protein